MIGDWEKKYGVTKPEEGLDLGDRFMRVLEAIHNMTGLRAVVLVDEYDKPILDVLDVDKSLEEEHRNLLKGFYSVFKEYEHLQFVFLTGVTKFSQVSVFSGFNQPEDISMSGDYETLCGITTEEIEAYFNEGITRMAEEYGCSYDDMKNKLKARYDGYHFSDNMTDIYNPFSMLNAMKSSRMNDYWFKSGTPTYLLRLLAHSDENMNEITGRYYAPKEFFDYKATVEQPLPMIYQSGYLTIKKYDMKKTPSCWIIRTMR